MTEQTVQQYSQPPSFWGAVSNFMDRLAETEVSLLTVLVIVAAVSLRELVGLYFKWRSPK